MKLLRAERRPDEDRKVAIVALYQVLSSRYASNTTLQWQLPLYIVPVQAALIVGIVANEGTLVVALGVVAACLGVLGAMVMWRIEQTARWDRQSLDEVEQVLLPSDSSLWLLHNSQFDERLRRKPLRTSRPHIRLIEQYVLRWFPPSRTIGLTMIVIGSVACAIGLSRHGSSSPAAPAPPTPQLVSSQLPAPG